MANHVSTFSGDHNEGNQIGSNLGTINIYNREVARAEAPKVVLNALYFPEMDYREDIIDDAYAKTFEWFPAEQSDISEMGASLVAWIHDPKQQIFWISGKAGSGKSTLMKKLYHDPNLNSNLSNWASEEALVIAGVFLYDRGTSELQKSREGLARSILYQILRQRPELIEKVFQDKFDDQRWLDSLQRQSFKWRWQVLKDALTRLISFANSSLYLCLFVDGMDEYSLERSVWAMEDEELKTNDELEQQYADRRSRGHEEITGLFTKLNGTRNLKLFLSSRPLNVFKDAFSSYPHVKLEDLTAGDIRTYVEGRLEKDSRMTKLRSEDAEGSSLLIAQIVSKASGVFLWVRIVVDRLIAGLTDRESIKDLRKTVSEIPQELGGRRGLFMRMLADVKIQHRAQASLFIRLVQRAERPLSLWDMFLAETDLNSIINSPTRSISETEKQQKMEWLEGRLRSRCAGLLEVQRVSSLEEDGSPLSKSPMLTVNFLHQTAKEFFMQTTIWNTILPPRSSPTEDENVVLLGICILRLKQVSPLERTEGNTQFTDLMNPWAEVIEALEYGREFNNADEPTQQVGISLFDELDRTMAIICLEPMKNSSRKRHGLPKTDHWTLSEPQEQGGRDYDENDTFLSFALQEGLYFYVTAKVHRHGRKAIDKTGHPLLVYGLGRKNQSIFGLGEKGFAMGQPSRWSAYSALAPTSIFELLLKNGADPNKKYEGEGIYGSSSRTPWEKLLKVVKGRITRADDTTREVININEMSSAARFFEIVRLFIQYGADPNLKITHQMRKRSSTYCSVLKEVSSIFEQYPTYRQQLEDLLISKGARYLAGQLSDLEEEIHAEEEARGHRHDSEEEKPSSTGELTKAIRVRKREKIKAILGFSKAK